MDAVCMGNIQGAMGDIDVFTTAGAAAAAVRSHFVAHNIAMGGVSDSYSGQ